MREQRVVSSGTSWISVVCGWLAAVGVAALVAPGVAAILAGRPLVPNDLVMAVPVVLGLMIAYVVGGYVSGRMAGHHTSWHGMMSAFFGLFVTLVALLVAAAVEGGVFAGTGLRSLSDSVPAVRQLDLRTLGDTLTFGAILSFLATIFAGWLGGVLAPEHPVRAPEVSVRSDVPSREAGPVPAGPAAAPRPRFRLLPAVGAKGGERVDGAANADRREASEGG